MSDKTGIDWTEAFANADFIPGGMEFPPRWAKEAQDFRDWVSDHEAYDYQELSYGDHQRQCLDLFVPKTGAKGLVVFVHGGFWLAFDKSSWSHLAKGALLNGWAVALPSYILAPEATIPAITKQIGQAITLAAQKVAGPINLTGHSAGGHLVSRMICKDSPLPTEVQSRIKKTISISGLHDLRPLQLAKMNENLKLTPDSASAESAYLNEAIEGSDILCWVGAAERPEFLRQSSLLAEKWAMQGTKTGLYFAEGKHHFDVVEDLCNPDSDLVSNLIGDTA
ncbi:alpha/beta hydrolase [Cohaesibacter gelatinilyticus]|uniref:Acetyl esterase/lipase n=1 Tax=Cohaesibacter gelatinilyticus TaxID=372072 RepID=A0A285PGF9_9HYPH|nr:alpha/beta hydrolase [Cohaesibacter gelatinilyticus]SNZ20347.1 Acetyl esterase/lipase [Cohaesibacter gelatinilyticus]